MFRVLAVMLLFVALTSPSMAQEFDFDARLADIDREIAAAENEAKKYSGGLVLSMIRLRIELLRYSKTIVEHGRLQSAVQKYGGFAGQWLPQTTPLTPKTTASPKIIGLLCGKIDRYAVPLIIEQPEKLVSHGGSDFVPYTETEDEILYKLGEDDSATFECDLNRFTLGLNCQKQGEVVEHEVTQCRLAGAAMIPNSGQYWLNCGVPGKPETNNAFKIALGINSTIEGGYLTWNDNSDDGTIIERCNINRFNGAIFCSVPDSAAGNGARSKRWDILDDPTCRVLPRRF